MSYTTLTGAKTVAGSIHNFANYRKVPAEVVLEEAQALIYSRLRVREMRDTAVITLSAAASTAALPTGFLEAIAMRDRDGWDVIPDRHVDERGLLRRRIYEDDVLQDGVPTHVAIFGELFQFDCAADEERKFDLVYFKTPTALSASNATNFLTRRYPHIVRIGCLAGAASYMKDDSEEAKQLTKLQVLCDEANAESDLGRAS
jgi:hypothetical protein